MISGAIYSSDPQKKAFAAVGIDIGGHSKVSDLSADLIIRARIKILFEHDIFRFQVSMHYVLEVQIVQCT